MSERQAASWHRQARHRISGMAATVALGVAGASLVPVPGSPRAQPPITREAAGAPHTEASTHAGLDARLHRFTDELRQEAQAAGISIATYDRAMAGITIDPTIPALLTSQPEHVIAPWDYMRRLVSEKRIADGLRMWAHHAATLSAIERSTGVDAHLILAIWGIESSYGTLPGTRLVIRSLATLCVADDRRSAFWRKQLLAALTIVDRGDITPDRMTGSWAGAMGHTQFMPTSFLEYAVDQDGNGQRDIWRSVPDALASTANYLRKAGWTPGETWGTEVVLPAGFDFAVGEQEKSIEAWQALGLVRPFGEPWPASLPRARLLLPAGLHGPAFLVGANFGTILRYNNAVAYALAVGHLASRLAGGPDLAALWPTGDPPLAKAERRELQIRLADLGHRVGPIDGVVGELTRAAVREWQSKTGLPADGWPGTHLLERLRSASIEPR